MIIIYEVLSYKAPFSNMKLNSAFGCTLKHHELRLLVTKPTFTMICFNKFHHRNNHLANKNCLYISIIYIHTHTYTDKKIRALESVPHRLLN